MDEPTTYELVVKGRPSDRLLQPLLDDFSVSRTDQRTTDLVGEVRDGSHLHGIVAHLSAVGVEIVRLGAVERDAAGGSVLSSDPRHAAEPTTEPTTGHTPEHPTERSTP